MSVALHVLPWSGLFQRTGNNGEDLGDVDMGVLEDVEQPGRILTAQVCRHLCLLGEYRTSLYCTNLQKGVQVMSQYTHIIRHYTDRYVTQRHVSTTLENQKEQMLK